MTLQFGASLRSVNYDRNMFIIQATGCAVVEHSTHIPKIVGSTPVTFTGKEVIAEKKKLTCRKRVTDYEKRACLLRQYVFQHRHHQGILKGDVSLYC